MTTSSSAFKGLRMLEPFDLGRVRLRNRIIGAPMERNMATVDGHLTDAYIRYLTARAAGGVALVFTEASYVRIDGKARHRQVGVHVDSTIDGLRRLVAGIHAQGALVGVEINHGGRTAQGRINGYNCVAPSPVPCESVGGEVPIELDEEEIGDIIESYVAAARRCVAAGVDVLSLHGAHGYLVHQFMSPLTNLRQDAWGDRQRFLNEVIGAVRAAVPDITFGLRFSALDGVPGGLDADKTFEVIKACPLDKLDFLDVSAGCYEAGQWMVQPSEWPEGLLGEHAARYRALGLPVSVAGRISKPETVERMLEQYSDLVSMARAFHADPEWVNTAAAGRSPRPCIVCNFCSDSLRTGEPIPCSVNPHVGHEREPATEAPAARRLAVTVVGGGPAGLETARLLADRGHTVTLFERQAQLGGDLRLAGGLHEYPLYHAILAWYERQLEELGVTIRRGEGVDAAALCGTGADVVVLATGGYGELPDVPGIEFDRVIEIRDWMRAGKPDLGREVHVVWGADREGVAVADELLHRGRRVVIVGGQHDLAPDVGRRAKALVVPRLTDSPDVEIVLESRVRAIEPERLLVHTADEGERWLALAGPILVSQGVTPDTRLQEELRHADGAPRAIPVGEAAGEGGYIATALSAGRRVALEIDAGHSS
jgi:2,4-dienoyl-CoA reductase-like NADH-dependent reductase (Old Yellow Enzyme family)/thioredoxin reductase